MRRFNLTDNHALVFEMGIPLPLADRNQGAKRQARYQLQKTKALQRHAETTARARLHELLETLSAEHYAELLLPYHQELTSQIDGPTILHVCGNCTDRLHHFAEAGFNGYHFEWQVDAKNAVEIVDDKMVLNAALIGAAQAVEIARRGAHPSFQALSGTG